MSKFIPSGFEINFPHPTNNGTPEQQQLNRRIRNFTMHDSSYHLKHGCEVTELHTIPAEFIEFL